MEFGCGVFSQYYWIIGSADLLYPSIFCAVKRNKFFLSKVAKALKDEGTTKPLNGLVAEIAGFSSLIPDGDADEHSDEESN